MDLQQENAHWQALQSEQDPLQQRIKLVEMAKLLLEKALADNPDWARCDSDDLTDLFLEYQASGEHISQFFQAALPYLDPEYKGQPFEQQLQTLHEQIANTIAQAARIVEQNQQWFAEQKHLQQEIEQLTTTQNAADELETNLRELRQQFETLQPQVARIKELGNESATLHEQISTLLTQAIPEIIEVLRKNYALYRTHLHENARIGTAVADFSTQLSDLGEVAQHGKEIGDIVQTVTPQLARLDELLARFIAEEENRRKAIRFG